MRSADADRTDCRRAGRLEVHANRREGPIIPVRVAENRPDALTAFESELGCLDLVVCFNKLERFQDLLIPFRRHDGRYHAAGKFRNRIMVVRFSAEECDLLNTMIRKGNATPRRPFHAQRRSTPCARLIASPFSMLVSSR
jgi:hypothetical protein